MAIFQNGDNRDLFLQKGIVSAEQVAVIRGVGVDLEQFSPRPEPSGITVVMLASRMLWEKGLQEFVTAAGKLREAGVMARFVLVGDPDPENPSSISHEQLRLWQESGLVEYWGHRNDMAVVLSQANVVCLPSYLEGFPKVLVEASACGRAIVTTDVPGCREIVRQGDNGFLVPPRDSDALASALHTLIYNPLLRSKMGARGREIAVWDFSEETICKQTIAIYQELSGARWSPISSMTHSEDQVLSSSKL